MRVFKKFVLFILVVSSAQIHATEFFNGRVKVNGFIAQHYQAVEAESGAAGAGEPGFSRMRLSLGFNFTVNERVSGYFELSEEPNDVGGLGIGVPGTGPGIGSGIIQDLAWIDIKLTDQLTFRTGQLVSTLHNFIPYSDGGIVQGNPLIGNSPIDFITAEQGAQLIGNHAMNGMLTNVGWDIGVSNARFWETGGFLSGQPHQFFGKLRLTFNNGLNIGGGYFTADGSDQFTSGVVNSGFGLGTGIASAIFQGDGDNYQLPGAAFAQSRETHIGLIPGVDVDMFQIDAKWEIPNTGLTLRGWGGFAEDNWRIVDASGAQTTVNNRVDAPAGVIDTGSELTFFGLEGVYRFNDSLYTAVRYSHAENETSGATGDTSLDRIMIGGGWWFFERTLAKIEYVKQSEGSGGPGNIENDWDGVIGELSVSF